MSSAVFKFKDIPSSLVDDFAVFMKYVKENEPVLTLKSQNLKQKDLSALNKLMVEAEKEVTPRSNQPSYPLLNLLFELSLIGGLTVVGGRASEVRLRPAERYSLYQELTDYEQYFFLLETLWIDADWPALLTTKYNRLYLHNVSQIIRLISEARPGEVIQVAGTEWQSLFYGMFSFLKYFKYFGFWEFTEGDSLSKLEYKADKIIPSRFGVEMMGILMEERDLAFWNQPFQESGGTEFQFDRAELLVELFFAEKDLSELSGEQAEELRGLLKKEVNKSLEEEENYKKEGLGEPFYQAFIPLFPEGQLENTLPRRDNSFAAGTYFLKVSLFKGVWRKIKIAGGNTLEDLHLIIQEAFDFDNDHLYAFYMDGKPWSGDCYNSPLDNRGPFADEVLLGELNLNVGRQFLYLFDFGDEWRFKVVVDEIGEPDDSLARPEIIGGRGDSPEQYSW